MGSEIDTMVAQRGPEPRPTPRAGREGIACKGPNVTPDTAAIAQQGPSLGVVVQPESHGATRELPQDSGKGILCRSWDVGSSSKPKGSGGGGGPRDKALISFKRGRKRKITFALIVSPELVRSEKLLPVSFSSKDPRA